MKTTLISALAGLAGVLALSLPATGAAQAIPDGPPPPPPGAPPPPPGAPPPPEEPIAAPVLDERAPVLKLRARRDQALAPVLRAYGMCDERCEFEASARVRGVPDVRGLRIVTPAKASDGGTRMRFEVLVSPRAEKLMWRVIREGGPVTVVVRVFAYDLADNETERSVTIRIGPPKHGGPPLRRS